MLDIAQLIQEVNERRGLLFQPASCRSEEYIAEFAGRVDGIGVLVLAFPKHFPIQIPDIYLQDTTTPHLHVESDGKICLTDESSLLINISDPCQLIMDCIDLAFKTLDLTPKTEEYEHALQNEFLSYWGLRSHGFIAHSILHIPTEEIVCREYPAFPFEKSYLVADSREEAQAYINNTLHREEKIEKPERMVLVIKLKNGCMLPSPFKQFDWSKTLRYILDNTDAETRQQFLSYIYTPIKKRTLSILLVVPRKGGDIVFGVTIRFNNNHKMPMVASKTKAVLHVNVIRRDYDYLLSRCGATSSLKSKKVLLLGCGSIGGFIANNLCQMGITQLDLLDDDVFRAENIHRHFLGFEGIRRHGSTNKADLLSSILGEKYAYLDIDPLNYSERSVEEVVLSSPEKLLAYDLVISALGEPTINLEINRLLVEQNLKIPFIVCFNEPYGIGGHIITTNISENSCLRCYYSEITAGTLSSFLGSLVAPDQNFKRSISGCAGTFVPYSTLDSQQTAIHAARKAVAVLNGALTNNDLFTWKGDSSLLVSHGFQASPLFNNTHTIHDFSNPSCPICKRRHKKH